jgi:type III restriction enzyme
VRAGGGARLRRTSYEVNPETGLFEPEYVNIFGVPFTFLPHEGGKAARRRPRRPRPRSNRTRPRRNSKSAGRMSCASSACFQPTLTLDWSKAARLELDAAQTAQVAELAPILEGKPDVTKISRIELERLAREFRTQRIIFETARDVFDQMKHTWQGSREVLLAQLVRLSSSSSAPTASPSRRRSSTRTSCAGGLIITLNMSRVVQHVWEAVRQENTERLDAGLRPRPSHPLHGRDAHLVHGQAVRAHEEVAHQRLRLRQHLGGVGRLHPRRQRRGGGLGQERPSRL